MIENDVLSRTANELLDYLASDGQGGKWVYFFDLGCVSCLDARSAVIKSLLSFQQRVAETHVTPLRPNQSGLGSFLFSLHCFHGHINLHVGFPKGLLPSFL